MIKLEKVNKYYNKGKANQIHVIDNTSMILPDRGIVCLLGPSGCGKTTLLNAIGGLDSVSSGRIKIDNQLITRFSSSKIDTIRNARIGYIFQNFNLLERLDVYDNVALPMKFWGINTKTAEADEKIKSLIRLVGLEDKMHSRPAELSGGQKQRVAN